MSDLYAIGALFRTPEELLNAAAAVRSNGYQRFDTNTPYPVHGLDESMGLKNTHIGLFAFLFGLLGMLAALVLQWWTSVVDYPLLIGGKAPFVAPAFVPVAFEVSILAAALGMVAMLFFAYLRLPFNAHPLHDSDYLRQVSSDRFGIYIESEDRRFEIGRVRQLLASLGAESIEAIPAAEASPGIAAALLDRQFIAGLLLLFIAVALATAVYLGVVIESAPFRWMNLQPRYSAQSSSDLFHDGSAMRNPVPGTIARGYLPYAYPDAPKEAGRNLLNPLLPTEAVMRRGQDRYTVFCSNCHGDHGHGDGLMKGRYPASPSLHSNKLRREWADGRLYHVMTVGRNAMPAFDSRISRRDRWAIVHYIRVLQRSAFAKESDLE